MKLPRPSLADASQSARLFPSSLPPLATGLQELVAVSSSSESRIRLPVRSAKDFSELFQRRACSLDEARKKGAPSDLADKPLLPLLTDCGPNPLAAKTNDRQTVQAEFNLQLETVKRNHRELRSKDIDKTVKRKLRELCLRGIHKLVALLPNLPEAGRKPGFDAILGHLSSQLEGEKKDILLSLIDEPSLFSGAHGDDVFMSLLDQAASLPSYRFRPVVFEGLLGPLSSRPAQQQYIGFGALLVHSSLLPGGSKTQRNYQSPELRKMAAEMFTAEQIEVQPFTDQIGARLAALSEADRSISIEYFRSCFSSLEPAQQAQANKNFTKILGRSKSLKKRLSGFMHKLLP